MIAISYRREDSTGITGRVYDRLQKEFGKPNVFMDFDSIPYGIDFREHIKKTLEKASVVVVVIGPEWLGQRARRKRRIDEPDDFVRLEVAGALEHGIPIIPVLIKNAKMPKPESLPSDITQLSFRNGIMLDSGIDFHHHTDRLITAIRAVAFVPNRRKAAVTGTTKAIVAVAQPRRPLLLGGLVLGSAIIAVAVWMLFFHSPKTIGRDALQPIAGTVSNSQIPVDLPGTVVVKTDPAGAMVKLGDQAQKSPAKFTGVTGNSTSVQITLSGYEPVQREFVINDTGATEIGPISLERAEETLPAAAPAKSATRAKSPAERTIEKLFAGTWRGTIHNVVTSEGRTLRSWDSEIELPIDETETRWADMDNGSVFRRGRTLAYTGLSVAEDGSKQQVHATLMVHEDGRSATYTTSARPVSGNGGKSFGKGTLERMP